MVEKYVKKMSIKEVLELCKKTLQVYDDEIKTLNIYRMTLLDKIGKLEVKLIREEQAKAKSN